MITQRLILDGGYPDGTWTCPGCRSPLTEGLIQHPDDCQELRRGNAPGPLPSVAQAESWMLNRGWEPDRPGLHGRLWRPPGRPEDAVAVLFTGDGVEFPGSLERITKRSGLPFGEVLAGMRATGVGESSDG